MKIRRDKIKVISVYFEATCGSAIGDCIDECIAFSSRNGIPCMLRHNGVEIEVSAKELSAKLFKEWDKIMNASESK